MKLSKTILAIVAAVASVGLLSSAQATPITGSMTFAGRATFDTGNIATALTVTSFSGAEVMDADGSFSGIASGSPVTMSAPWTFAPPPGVARANLWSVGGFTFDLSGTTGVSRPVVAGIQFLVISGVGTIFGPPGFDPTPGNWSFSTQTPAVGGKFSFSAATSAVPDGGMTGTLLGAALIGLAAYRAKFAKPVKA
jgi:hypothetical protein